jgi:biopolymer transport protein ExbD
MAGSSSSEDNPIAVNVVPMVDVIFCLCLFFMCSLHFKQLEGRIETWLPKTGNQQGVVTKPLLENIRVLLAWDHAAGRTVRKVGSRLTPTDLDFEEALNTYSKSFDLSVAVDATADVPWRDAVRVVDLCHQNGFLKVDFVEPAYAFNGR